MSEVEAIGQRMREHLLASGLLSSVDIELHEQEESLVLILSPQEARRLSPQYERIMRFCLNFQGDQKCYAQNKDVFVWCGAYVEAIAPDKTCRVWMNCQSPTVSLGGDVLLVELILMGLRLSRSLSPVAPQEYHPKYLTQVFQEEAAVLASYEHLTASVIGAGDDMPGAECDPSLYPFGLCCPKHRFLFVQRLMLTDWLHHFIWSVPVPDEGEDRSRRAPLAVSPLAEALQWLLTKHLQEAFSPQSWFQAYFAYHHLVEEQHWYRPTPRCEQRHLFNWACCPLHTTLKALTYLFDQWLVRFEHLFHMSDMVDEQGDRAGFGSIDELALFMHLAHLDSSCCILFPQWFHDVLSVDVQRFHHREVNTCTCKNRPKDSRVPVPRFGDVERGPSWYAHAPGCMYWENAVLRSQRLWNDRLDGFSRPGAAPVLPNSSKENIARSSQRILLTRGQEL